MTYAGSYLWGLRQAIGQWAGADAGGDGRSAPGR